MLRCVRNEVPIMEVLRRVCNDAIQIVLLLTKRHECQSRSVVSV